MKKLKAVIQYECMTSFKYIWLFYAIQYAIVTLIMLIIGISTGTFEDIGTNVLEINSLMYVGLLGALGFSQDFKMLLQNGFTRKIIFIGTLSMFFFVCGTMAFIDTIVGNLIHYFNHDYSSLYSSIYGYDNIFMNWLWLFLAYVFICCLLYLAVLALNKAGKMVFIASGVILGGGVLVVIALFRYVFSAELVSKIADFFTRAMGFMGDGTVNYFFPAVTLILIISALSFGAYAVIRSTELR